MQKNHSQGLLNFSRESDRALLNTIRRESIGFGFHVQDYHRRGPLQTALSSQSLQKVNSQYRLNS
jgi:hypothetical protein